MNEKLRKLIAEVCQQPPQSLEQQKALNRLLLEIQHLPGLAKSSHPDYFHALNRTWEWLSKNLHTFKPRPPSLQTSLVKWINGYLYWRIQDLYAPDENAPHSFEELVEKNATGRDYLEKLSNTGFGTPNLDGLDGYVEQLQRQETQRIGLIVQQYIERDPEEKLQKCHPKANSQCNCWLLSRQLCLKDPPDKLTDLAKELKVNYQSLVSHWKRKCLPILQEIAKNLGYQPNSTL